MKLKTSAIKISDWISDNPLLSIVCLFLIKATFALLLVYLSSDTNARAFKAGVFSYRSGDTFSYIGAMENYINEGTYYFHNGREKIYAGRLPHYATLYMAFRQFLDVNHAYDALAVLQLILESISIFFLFKLCFRKTHSSIGSLAIIMMALFAGNTTLFAVTLSPESLSCSLLILFLYCYDTYRTNDQSKFLFAAALLLGVLVTLKAYFILVYAFVGLERLLIEGFNVRRLSQQALILGLPLFALLAPWSIRNYNMTGKFIPLQVNTWAGYNYTKSELALREYIIAWGGDFIFWEKKSAGCYFIPTPGIQCEFQMPSYAMTERYGIAEIEEARREFISLKKNYNESLDQALSKKFNAMRAAYRNENPVRSFLISPLVLAKQFLIHSGSYYMPSGNTTAIKRIIELCMKVWQTVLYWLCLTAGMIGLSLIGFRRREWIFFLLPVLLVVLFPMVLGFAEARYFRTSEPVLYLGVIFAFVTLYRKIRDKTVVQPAEI